MPVARESIVEALQGLEKLEETTLANLEKVTKDPSLEFPSEFKKEIIDLIQQLKSGGEEHPLLVRQVVKRLNSGAAQKKTGP